MLFSFFRRMIIRNRKTSTGNSIITTTTGAATALTTALTVLYSGGGINSNNNPFWSCQAFTLPLPFSSSSVSSAIATTTEKNFPFLSSALGMSSSSSSSSPTPSTSLAAIPTWKELQDRISTTTVVGKALDEDLKLRQEGKGSPHVHNRLRLFEENTEKDDEPKYTLYRDHAGWCPYCQKTMLLIEAKEIPIKIELINMRSYGDKPTSFLRKVPNGLLPAIEQNDKSGRIVLDSARIMEFLDTEYDDDDKKKKQMIPNRKTQPDQYNQYERMMKLERELFSWWCTFMFRPEQPPSQSSLMKNLFGGAGGNDDTNNNDKNDGYVSPTMKGFLNCLQTVNDGLESTNGPFFLDYDDDHPTMIDFVYASHVERMFASCAYWKGMNLRSSIDYPQFSAIQKWMDSLEKHDYYLAFKSDYYTHVKDIPPQYGPSSTGYNSRRIQQYQSDIEGKGSSSSSSWKLPLDDDEVLQPLYNGVPLPIPVLDSMNIRSDEDGSYRSSSSSVEMKFACQLMAVWKLCQNGKAITKFACRGGPNGSKNMNRKMFGAELADPYAESDPACFDTVDTVLRIVAYAMINISSDTVNTIPGPEYTELLRKSVVNDDLNDGTIHSLEYLRDRIGVPRDLPLASARYLRAYLNWSIDVLSSATTE